MKKIFFTIFFLSSIYLFSENLFKGEGEMDLYPPRSYKGKGIYEKIGILSIVPVDNKRFFGSMTSIIEREDLMADMKAIEKEAKENKGFVKSFKGPEWLELSRFLAILDKDGKILQRSDEFSWDQMPEIGYVHTAYPLVMDETDKCPYALYYPGKLLCFDLNLNKKSEFDIPLDFVEDVKVTFDGEKHSIWIFGKIYEKEKKFSTIQDYKKSKPEKVKKVGKKFILEKEKLEELPFTFDELFQKIEKVARNWEGEKAKLNPSLVNIEAFSDMENKEGFWLWVEAAEAENIESVFKYSGTIHFFRVYLDSMGLGKAVQVPFWIVKENIKEQKVDKEKGILYLPEYVVKGKTKRVYQIGKNDFLFHFREGVSFPDEKGNFNTLDLDVLSYYIYFPSDKEKPEIYDFYEEIWPQIAKDLEKGDFHAAPMFGIFSRISKYEFLFKGSCRDKDKKYNCLIKASLQK